MSSSSSPPAPPDPVAYYGVWRVNLPAPCVHDITHNGTTATATHPGADARHIPAHARTSTLIVSSRTPLHAFLSTFGSFCVRVDNLSFSRFEAGKHLYKAFAGSLVCDEATWGTLNRLKMEDTEDQCVYVGKQPWILGTLTLMQYAPQKDTDKDKDNGGGVDVGVRSPQQTHSIGTQTESTTPPQGRNEGSGGITFAVPAASPIHIPAAHPLADVGRLGPGPGGGGYSRDHDDGSDEGTAGPSRQSQSDLDVHSKKPSPIRVAEAPPLEPDSPEAGRLRVPVVGRLGLGPPALEVIPGGSGSDLDSVSGVKVLPEGSGESLDQGLGAIASAKAQEHCRTAMNALEFSDAEKARAEIRAAIALLGGEI